MPRRRPAADAIFDIEGQISEVTQRIQPYNAQFWMPLDAGMEELPAPAAGAAPGPLAALIAAATAEVAAKTPKIRLASDKKYEPICERGSATPRFFIHYASPDEYRLRLRHSYILYQGSPIWVDDVTSSQLVRGVVLRCRDIDGDTIEIPFGDSVERDKMDSRTLQPGYLDLQDSYGRPVAGYLHRIPARVYKQGISSENSRVMIPYEGIQNFSIGLTELRSALQSRIKKQPLPGALEKLRKESRNLAAVSAPLSTNFAVGKSNGAFSVFYRGVQISDLSTKDIPDADLLGRMPETLHEELKELKLAA